MLVVTNSSLSAYRQCPRRYQYSYVLLLRPDTTIRAIELGSFTHTVLETLYRDGPGALGALEAFDGWDKLSPDDRDLVGRMLAGYMSEFYENGVDRQFKEPLKVEHEFSVPLPDTMGRPLN